MDENVDPKLVQLACMADLSRARQEELPLSSTTRGDRVSFAPGRRQGTSHLPENLKNAYKKWDTKIDDEESKQMEGLQISDSRPWATKLANQYMANNQRRAAPPMQLAYTTKVVVNLPSHAPAMYRQSNRIASKGRTELPTTTVAPGWSSLRNLVQETYPVSEKKPSKVEFTPTQPLVVQTKPPSSPAKVKSHTMTKHDDTISVSTNVREHILLSDACAIKTASSQPFAATFTMKVLLQSSQAYLVLSVPGKGEKVYDVLDLEPPVIRGDICWVTGKPGKADFTYQLKLEERSKTEQFQLYLKSLQQAAVNTSPVCKQTGANGSPAPGQVFATGQIEDVTTENSVDLNSKCSEAQSGTIGKDTPSLVVEPHAVNPDAPLIDLEEGPASNNVQEVHGGSIENAAEHLYSLVRSMIPYVAGQGCDISENTIQELEDAAISNWTKRGFLDSEADGMKDDMMDMLRLLTRIKRRASSKKQRKEILETSPALEALRENMDQPPRQARIQYTESELRSLKSDATPMPKLVEVIRVAPQGNKKVVTKTNVVSAVSNHMEWLTNNEPVKVAPKVISNVPDPTAAPFKPAFRGLATSRWANPNGLVSKMAAAFEADCVPKCAAPVLQERTAAKTVNDESAPRAALSAPRGLSSSRWA